MRGTSGTPRHTKRSRYRCSLPGLAGFAGLRRTEPEVPRIGSHTFKERLPKKSSTATCSKKETAHCGTDALVCPVPPCLQAGGQARVPVLLCLAASEAMSRKVSHGETIIESFRLKHGECGTVCHEIGLPSTLLSMAGGSIRPN
jgi:hypothetical protein